MKENVRSPTILSSLLEKLRRLAKEKSVIGLTRNIVDENKKKEIIMILKRKLVNSIESITQKDGLMFETLFFFSLLSPDCKPPKPYICRVLGNGYSRLMINTTKTTEL